MDTDDADLVARVGGGDRRAMRALYETYQQAVFAFAYARCGQADRASDCVHDTMLAVWRTAARFSGRSSVKTWLFAIARNKLADILRKRGRLTFVEEVEDGPDTAPNPEAAAIAASDSARLHRCLDGVSDRHRPAIRLAFLEDLSYPEIPEIESVPVGHQDPHPSREAGADAVSGIGGPAVVQGACTKSTNAARPRRASSACRWLSSSSNGSRMSPSALGPSVMAPSISERSAVMSDMVAPSANLT